MKDKVVKSISEFSVESQEGLVITFPVGTEFEIYGEEYGDRVITKPTEDRITICVKKDKLESERWSKIKAMLKS